MNKKSLVVPPETYREVVKYLEGSKKIQAIKLVREATGAGLKEAKMAVDRLQQPTHIAITPEHPVLVANPQVVKIILDYGSGPVELDLEGMQLKALTQLPTIGLDACAHMLELVEIFRALSEGKKIKIIDDQEDLE